MEQLIVNAPFKFGVKEERLSAGVVIVVDQECTNISLSER